MDDSMPLRLENVSRSVNGEIHIHNANISFKPNSFNVLLGRALAGKTSLIRLIAGLDTPCSGRIHMRGIDVTKASVQRRNISMVYPQFINYPTLTVHENIASPLHPTTLKSTDINRRVQETASILRIERYLKCYPRELSRDQQQRVAMARALVKNASLVLMDEPLVNLHNKLQEQFRQELREWFKTRNTIAVYATAEPSEALSLGSTTTLLHQGKIIQSGTTTEVYRAPVNVDAAELFSEPSVNLISARVSETQVTFNDGLHFPLHGDLHQLQPGNYRLGVRPGHIGLVPHSDEDMELSMQVELAKINGSETFIQVKNKYLTLTLQLPGIHSYHINTSVKIYLPPHKLFVFSEDGIMIQTPYQQANR